MGKYIGKRLLQMIPLLLGITFLVFLLLYIAPGDPAAKRLTSQGMAVTQEAIDNMREQMGLNRPFLVQYGDWLWNALHLNLGDSYRDGFPVVQKLGNCIGNTVILAVSSLLLSVLIAVPLGIASAVRQDSVLDHVVRLLTFVGNSMPNFLISILLMYFLCIKLNLFPVIATGSVQGLAMPTIALAIPMMSRFIRQIRAEVLEEMGKDYVTGMAARGVKNNWILYRNILHNTLPALITIVGLSIGTLMGGSVVIESIFSWPGLGKLVMDSITARDYPTIQGFVLIIAVIYVVINLLTDISYHLIDRRVELK